MTFAPDTKALDNQYAKIAKVLILLLYGNVYYKA